MDWEFVPLEGASRGIPIMWDLSLLLKEGRMGGNFLAIRFKHTFFNKISINISK